MNPGIHWFMNGLSLGTGLMGGAINTQKVDLRGTRGIGNIELPGTPPTGWHLDVRDEHFWVRKGLHPTPAATIRLKEETFLQLLDGTLSSATAIMTGRVQVQGDAHFGLIFIALCSQFRVLATGESRMGRALARVILRRAGRPPVQPEARASS
ncbi:SCP2 sterol-binding domain-containing protein [Myxococcaceae bacterium JPH2]|nr:SCP2 sterol-binding domain-containing protein [Myxococcaceae bacterium JPH2]